MRLPRRDPEVVWIYSVRKAYPAMAHIYLLVVSQSLFHWQGSSGGEVCMKKNWRRVNSLSCCSYIGPFWVFVFYVCMWMEGMGFWDTGLEKNSSQEICTSLLTTLSYPLVRNKSYLCCAFICVLGTPISPELSITEDILYDKQKITETEKSLMQVFIIRLRGLGSVRSITIVNGWGKKCIECLHLFIIPVSWMTIFNKYLSDIFFRPSLAVNIL